MINVYVEIPSGAQSRGYDCEVAEDAVKVMTRLVSQLRSFTKFTADVIAEENGVELVREHINNA